MQHPARSKNPAFPTTRAGVSVSYRLFCAGLAFLMATAETASAQTVRGQVLDVGTGQPIAGVRVTLINAAGAKVAESISTTAGRFSFLSKTPGDHKIATNHIGYSPVTTGNFLVRENEVVEVDVKVA